MNFRRIGARSLHHIKSATRFRTGETSSFSVNPRPQWTPMASFTTAADATGKTKEDAVSLAERYVQYGNHGLALQIFDSLNVNDILSPPELALYVEILAKTKGLAAAKAYFKKVDPHFNHQDLHAKNWPAYAKLVRLTSEQSTTRPGSVITRLMSTGFAVSKKDSFSLNPRPQLTSGMASFTTAADGTGKRNGWSFTEKSTTRPGSVITRLMATSFPVSKKDSFSVNPHPQLTSGTASFTTASDATGKRNGRSFTFTKEEAVSLAERYVQYGKHGLALEIFDSLDRNEILSPSELALYVEILAKVKGLAAAKAYFKKVDPDFNDQELHAKNWPAYAKLVRLTSEQANHLHPHRRSYSTMAASLSPSVVSLSVKDYDGVGTSMAGSGFLIDNTTIVTCSHIVVNHSRLHDDSYIASGIEAKVVLHDGTTLRGAVARYDVQHDVALVRVDTSRLPDGSFSPVKCGFPNLVRQGDWIGCFGTPLGLANTMTIGIVSAIRTELDSDWGEGQYFQVDCSVLEGSCGGPIVGLDGSVIGMVCAAHGFDTQDCVAQEHGIAISMDTVRPVLGLI